MNDIKEEIRNVIENTTHVKLLAEGTMLIFDESLCTDLTNDIYNWLQKAGWI